MDTVKKINRDDMVKITEFVLKRKAQQSRFIDYLADSFSFSLLLESKKDNPNLGFLEDLIMLSRDFAVIKNRLQNKKNKGLYQIT